MTPLARDPRHTWNRSERRGEDPVDAATRPREVPHDQSRPDGRAALADTARPANHLPALRQVHIRGYPVTAVRKSEPSETATLGATTNDAGTAAHTGVPNAESALHSCRCGARWGGSRTAHCAAPECHRTFAGFGGFDAHRRNGACIDPATIGMAFVAGRPYECWGYPADDADMERVRALRGDR